MAIFHVEKTRDYTVMSNHRLRNRELSLKAGFPSLMLFLPDEWDCTLKGLAKLSRYSVDSVRSAVVELENEGYILRRQNRNAHGRLATNEYTVYEVPRQTKSIPDLPLSENPTQSNTKEQIIQELNTHLIKYPSINPSQACSRQRV